MCGNLWGHHFWAQGWRYAEEPLYDHLSWEGWFWGGLQPSPEHLHSQGLCPVGSSVSLRLGLPAERFLCTTVSHAQATCPGCLHPCLSSPTARVLMGAYVPLHPHTGWPSPSPRPRHLPTPWPLAIGLGASILKDGIADCSGSDLHVLSFDVF